MKREAKFTTKLKKYLQAEFKQRSVAAAYEIKVTTDKSIPFSAVSKHQLDALTAVRTGVFLYKLPDAGWQNPFDLLAMSEQEAYIVLAFLTPRKKASVWFIDVEVFKELQKRMERKSLTESILRKAHEEYDYWCRNELV